MGFIAFANSKIKKFNWLDIQLIKISVFGFTLLVASFWEALLELDQYWYIFIFLLPILILLYRIFGKKEEKID